MSDAVIKAAGRGTLHAQWVALGRESLREIRKDWLIHTLVLVYAAVVGIMAVALNQQHKLVYGLYGAIWLQAVFAVAGLYVAVVEVPRAILRSPDSPLRELRRRLALAPLPRLVSTLAILGAVILCMGTFTSVKNMLPDLSPFVWDPPLAKLDAALHGGIDPWRLLQPVMGHHLVTRIVQFCYTGGWMFVLCAMPVLVACAPQLQPIRLRFFLTYFAAWIVLGNVMAGVFMSAGPVYYGHVTGDEQRFAPLMAYHAFSEGLAHSSYDLQRQLWDIYASNQIAVGTGISAFPSMHLAIATLALLVSLRLNRWAVAAASMFLVIIMAGSVHLAWHYAVDGYVSIVVVLLLWKIAGPLSRLGRAAGLQST